MIVAAKAGQNPAYTAPAAQHRDFTMDKITHRIRVIGPLLALMTIWVFWFNGGLTRLDCCTPAMSAVFLFGPYAGPFVGLCGPVIGYEALPIDQMIACGLPLLAMIGAHPVHPRWWTGLCSVAGILAWFLFSMSYIHQASA